MVNSDRTPCSNHKLPLTSTLLPKPTCWLISNDGAANGIKPAQLLEILGIKKPGSNRADALFLGITALKQDIR